MHGFYSRFLQSAEKYPDHIAAELQHSAGDLESYSYRDLRRMAESVGRWLQDSGMSEGIRCAILASNGPLWVASYLGVISAGAVAVPLDTSFNHHQVNKLLWDSGSTVLFTDSRNLAVAETAVEETLVRIVMIDGSGQGRYSNLLGMFSAGPGNYSPAAIDNEELAVIMYTSGTTSDPKGVMLTHKNLLAEADGVFEIISVGPTDAVLAVLPLFHALAQMANLILPFAKGARIVYLDSMNTSELLRALSERGITLFCCVPQFFYLIHERVFQEVKKRSWAARLAFRSLMGISAMSRKLGINAGRIFFGKIHAVLGKKMRYLITGGSAFDARIGHDLHILGFNVLQAYGLTEASGGSVCTPPGNNILGSVGQPLGGVEVRIIDPQPAENLQYPVGEVALKGGIVMKGYYNRPDATAEVIREGWLYTGDLGYLDTQGNLFITGRKKEIIVLSSGKNIYPEEIETHYLQSPLIREICVMGLTNRPGEPVSERLHAVIVPNFDVLRERKIVNVREVIKFDVENLSTELPSTKRILSFDIWPDPLPRTTTRKLKRFEIQRRVVQQRALASDGKNGAASTVDEPSAEEALWLADPQVQRAVAIIQRASKNGKPALPASNLELDLGFDSMERVELVLALEREMGAKADEKTIAEVYTVKELVDAILKVGAGAGGASTPGSPFGWEAIFGVEPDDPQAQAVIRRPRLQAFFWYMVGMLVSLMSRIFYGLRVSGEEKLPRNGPFILSPNHQSFFDGPVVMSQMPWRLFKEMFFVGTSEIFGQGPLAAVAKSIKLVPVDPDSNLVSAMQAGAFGLKHGKILMIYPEGERSIDGFPKRFKKGAAILATHLRVPIYPVAIEGFYDAWPRHRKLPRLSKLHVQFGDPIFPPESFDHSKSDEVYKQLTDELQGRVVEMWEGLHNNGHPQAKGSGGTA
ncbi:MAG TPA: AMP-binding protein [Candidatus Angelobacter sp.]|nr:AMP-binding protein [Candidatus Angelobacter sp.]